MVNNLQELYNKQHGSETAQELAEKEAAIRQSGFSFFIGTVLHFPFFFKNRRGKLIETALPVFSVGGTDTVRISVSIFYTPSFLTCFSQRLSSPRLVLVFTLSSWL